MIECLPALRRSFPQLRYLVVGGPGPALEDELLYRFEFPERPGALMQFLETLDAASEWAAQKALRVKTPPHVVPAGAKLSTRC